MQADKFGRYNILFEVLDYPDFGGDKDKFSSDFYEKLAKDYKGKQAYFCHFYESEIQGWDENYFNLMPEEEKLYISIENGGFPCAKKYLRLLK